MAALLVAFYHRYHERPDSVTSDWLWLYELRSVITNMGAPSIDIFFVLSGFLLAFHYADRTPAMNFSGRSRHVSQYFKRRILRIFPAFFVHLIVLSFLGSVIVQLSVLNIWHWVAQATLIQPFIYPFSQPINGVLWTLPTEWGFYLLLPLVALVNSYNRLFQLTLTVIAIAIVTRSFLLAHSDGLSQQQLVWLLGQIPFRIDQFVLGTTIGLLFQRDRAFVNTQIARFVPSSLPLFLGGFLLFALVSRQMATSGFWALTWQAVTAHTATAVATIMMILGCVLGERLPKILFNNTPMQFAGEASFSIYLWHFPIFLIFPLQGGAYGLLREFMVLGIVAALSAMSYRFVERPFLQGGSENRCLAHRHPLRYPFHLLALFFLVIVGRAYMLDEAKSLKAECAVNSRIMEIVRSQDGSGHLRIHGEIHTAAPTVAREAFASVGASIVASVKTTERAGVSRQAFCPARNTAEFVLEIDLRKAPPDANSLSINGRSDQKSILNIANIPLSLPNIFGRVDRTAVKGERVEIHGWVLSREGTPSIRVEDESGRLIATGRPGQSRMDVAQAWPKWENAANSGFVVSFVETAGITRKYRVIATSEKNSIAVLSSQ